MDIGGLVLKMGSFLAAVTPIAGAVVGLLLLVILIG